MSDELVNNWRTASESIEETMREACTALGIAPRLTREQFSAALHIRLKELATQAYKDGLLSYSVRPHLKSQK